MSVGLRTGLRRRVQRAGERIRGQHERLRALLRDAERAAHQGAPIREPVARLIEGLRAHFEIEEEVYFPALRGLERTAQPSLVRLAGEHRSFLDELDALRADPPDAAVRLLLLGRALREHEEHEERLFGDLLPDPASAAR